jgi:hypothetical protein
VSPIKSPERLIGHNWCSGEISHCRRVPPGTRARLRNQAHQSGRRLSQVRLRKAIVFDRLLARLHLVAPSEWTLKGGLALDFRLGPSARMTRDIDLAYHEDADAATAALIAAQSADLGDHFTFAIRRTDQLVNLEGAAVRFHAQAALAGRVFDEVTIDISFSDPLGWPPERYRAPALLEFAEIAALDIPILPLEQHIAEKMHAYTRGYGEEGLVPSSRVKDLIDLVLIQGHTSPLAGRLRAALDGIFAGRGTHPLPTAFPDPPREWTAGYQQLARDVGLVPEMSTGCRLVMGFLDPILRSSVSANSRWNPTQTSW